MYGGYHRLLWLFLCLHYLVCLCVVILQQTIIWNVFYVSSMLIGDIGMFWALQINNIHKGFELYQVTMHNLLCQSVPMFPLCILLTRRINIFWSESIDTFWSGAIGTVWHRKSHTQKKIDSIHKDFFNYTNFSCIIFYGKLSQNSHFAHYLQTTETTYYLSNSILCHHLPPAYLFLN